MAVPAPTPSVAPGQKVQLDLPRIGRLPGTIDGVAPGGLTVVLAVSEPRLWWVDGQDVSVEYVAGQGIRRFRGTLAVEPRDADRLHVAVKGEAEHVQRRKWVRVDAVLPIAVQALDEPAGGETTTRDISGGGLLVTDPWRLRIGGDVRIALELEPNAPRVRALARVVRAAGPDATAVRIDDMSREDRERLVRAVREREVAALRIARSQ